MTLRIAILDDYIDAALSCADWSDLPEDRRITVFNDPFPDEDAAAAALRDFDVIVAMRERTPFPASLIRRLPDLRLLITTGRSNASIDTAAACERNIVVCGTRMADWNITAEHAWALILALVKHITREDRLMRQGGWQGGFVEGLKGRTLAVLGLGRIGAAVARVGNAFDMRVIAWSENLTRERCAATGATLVGRDALFREADILTIHLKLSERTRGLVGARELGLMKSSAYLVNTARAAIVNEVALIESLRRGHLAGAGLEVFETEPLPPDHVLRKLENVILTGHISFVERGSFELAYGDAVENILAWLAGKPVRMLGPDQGSRPTRRRG
jgi:phosphoglycerate dehydrogenase-like enzyme